MENGEISGVAEPDDLGAGRGESLESRVAGQGG
jgi:hypothetical protein